MRIAITGASGFVGRHVLAALAASQGVEVLACTRTPVRALSATRPIRVMTLDVASPTDAVLDEIASCDVLIHMAWGGLPNYMSRHHYEAELPAQYLFLKALIERGLPSLLVTGTCLEYGMKSGPLSETQAVAPSNPYGFAKDCLRTQLEFLRHEHDFALTWARLFYMWGEGQGQTALYPTIKAAAEQLHGTFPMSGGDQLRDYLPVAQVADLLCALARRNVDGGIVNVCSGKPISVRKLVEGWVSENGWDIRLDLGRYPYPEHEPMAFWGTTHRLEELLGRRDEQH